MANTFQDVFGDMLISAPVDKNETMLPSPEKLKRKIILKHKKLPEGYDDARVPMQSSAGVYDPQAGGDIANSVKNGILYVFEDELGWQPHFFVLTETNIYYSEVPNQSSTANDDESDDEDHTFMRPPLTHENSSASLNLNTQSKGSPPDESELHFSEPLVSSDRSPRKIESRRTFAQKHEPRRWHFSGSTK